MIICLNNNNNKKSTFLAYPVQLHQFRQLKVDSVSTFSKLSFLEAMPTLKQASTYVKNVMFYIMRCLWAFCQIISIFLLWVPMILDSHYSREGNILPASPHSWNIHRSKLERPFRLGMLCSDGAWPSLSSLLFTLVALLLLSPTSVLVIYSLSFLLGNNLSSLYPIANFTLSFAVPTVTLLSVYLSEELSNWPEIEFSHSTFFHMETIVWPPPVSCKTSI